MADVLLGARVSGGRLNDQEMKDLSFLQLHVTFGILERAL